MTQDNGIDDITALLHLIADIRKAAGDPDGRLMQDELVARIREIREERDALAAHVERLHAAIHEAAMHPVSVQAETPEAEELQDLREIIGDAASEKPTTSLARLKAEWQAEALENLAQANSRDLIHPQIVMDLANELRRQASEQP